MDGQTDEEKLALMAEFVGPEFDLEVGRKILKKHLGNLEKAVNSMLAGDTGQTEQTSTIRTTVTQPDATVIDLTETEDEEDELNQAIKLSKTTSSHEPTTTNTVKFAPSTRAADPNWQMVPTNTSSSLSFEDKSLNQAIQASLQDVAPELPEQLTLEKSRREAGRPVALIPNLAHTSYFYATLIIHALFFVPQVRQRISTFPIDLVDSDSVLFRLLDLFTNLDLAQISVLHDDEVIPTMHVRPLGDALEHPGKLSTVFLALLVDSLEDSLSKDEAGSASHLFKFPLGRMDARSLRVEPHATLEKGFIINLESTSDPSCPNALVPRLRDLLHNNKEDQDVIAVPSDVVAFYIAPSSRRSTPSVAQANAEPFVYPKYAHMDIFLGSNFRLARAKRKEEQEMLARLESLRHRKKTISRFNGEDTIKNLEGSIYYYEHLASGRSEPARQAALDSMTDKLKTSLNVIRNELSDIDAQMEQLQNEVSKIFDCPELQQLEYELRAVLIYTGLPGRKNIYSYVQDLDGKWWKTMDSTVTEVHEDIVLNDPTGLHLGGGPYLLIYSRRMPKEEMTVPLKWPPEFAARVERHNQEFLASLESTTS